MRPLLFAQSPAPLPAYGVALTAAFLLGALWLMSRLDELELDAGAFWAMGYGMLAAIFVGAKLGFILNEWGGFRADPWLYIRYWRGGWTYWTGLLGGMLAIWAFLKIYNRGRRRPLALLSVYDQFAVVLPLGQAIGRLGCFANGCCHGRPTGLPWGVRFSDPFAEVARPLLGAPLHPTQLYEAAGLLALFLLLALRVSPLTRAGRYARGTPSFVYLIGYSSLRFLVEFFRGDDRGVLLWDALSPAQWIALAVLAGAALAWRRRPLFAKGPGA